MKLNEKELKKLPKADALCLVAYVKSVEASKEYQEKIDSLHAHPDHLSYKIFSLVKETHENYGNILLNILSEMPTITDSLIEKQKTRKKSKKKN